MECQRQRKRESRKQGLQCSEDWGQGDLGKEWSSMSNEIVLIWLGNLSSYGKTQSRIL
jgi:hypothetical protein